MFVYAGTIYFQEGYWGTLQTVSTSSGAVTTSWRWTGVGTTAIPYGGGLAFDSNAGIAYISATAYNIMRAPLNSTVGSLLAGNGCCSTHYADGTGSAAAFYQNAGLAVHPVTGNVFVADFANSVIRMVTPAGVVTTVAGFQGHGGFADGTGTSAIIDHPIDVSFGPQGNILYIADGTHRIRQLEIATGKVTTLAGNGSASYADGVGTSAAFNCWVPGNVVLCHIVVDGAGNTYVGDPKNARIRKVSPTGVVTTVAGGVAAGSSYADGTGTVATFSAIRALAIDYSVGTLYVSDGTGIRVIN
jgi:hypothetical protein